MTTDASFHEGTLTLRLYGELDHHAARPAVEQMEQNINTYLPSECVLNLEGLTFMDSSGLAVILKTYRRIGELGGTLSVEGVTPQPGKVIFAAGLERIINIRIVQIGGNT